MGLRPIGARHLENDVSVSFSGERRALSATTVRRVVRHVLDAEHATARLHVTFMAAPRMRSLNRNTFGRDRSTDVIAFGMDHDGKLVGDVYICPGVARRSAREYQIDVRVELVRLVVHGVLHVLGYHHSDGPGRVRSKMWKQQESYVNQLVTA